MALLHVGVFQLAVDSRGESFWHRLTPRARVVRMVLFVFATALTPNGRWWTWAVYGAGLAIALLLSRVTLWTLARRVAVEFVFIGMILLGTLFQGTGEILWQWGFLQITTGGLTVLGSVALKALLSLMMVNLLVLTTPIPDLLHAFRALRMPPLLVAIMAAMYRYIGVLIDEFKAMQRAALSRNLLGRRHWQRMVLGNMIGGLFIRSYDRGDRIHQAMLARGYTGSLPRESVPPAMGKLIICAAKIKAALTPIRGTARS